MEIKNGFDYLKNDESLNRDGIKKVFVFDADTNKLFSPSAKELGLSGSFSVLFEAEKRERLSRKLQSSTNF